MIFHHNDIRIARSDSSISLPCSGHILQKDSVTFLDWTNSISIWSVGRNRDIDILHNDILHNMGTISFQCLQPIKNYLDLLVDPNCFVEICSLCGCDLELLQFAQVSLCEGPHSTIHCGIVCMLQLSELIRFLRPNKRQEDEDKEKGDVSFHIR